MKRWSVRLLFEPRDIWIGVYWTRRESTYRTDSFTKHPEFAYVENLDIYICLVPMLPLYVSLPLSGYPEVKR